MSGDGAGCGLCGVFAFGDLNNGVSLCIQWGSLPLYRRLNSFLARHWHHLAHTLMVPSVISSSHSGPHSPRLHVTISLPFGLVMTPVIARLCGAGGSADSGLPSSTFQLQRRPSSSPAITAPSPRLKAGRDRGPDSDTLWPEKVCRTCTG